MRKFRKKFFNYPFKRTQIFVLTFILLFCFRIKFSYIKNATYYQMMRNLSEYKCRKKKYVQYARYIKYEVVQTDFRIRSFLLLIIVDELLLEQILKSLRR